MQQKRQKSVRFHESVQYFYYEKTFEDYREIKYNRFIKQLWRKHNEVSKQIEQFSLLLHNQVPPKQQIVTLISIFEKLQNQEKRVIDCLSEATPWSPAQDHMIKEEEIRVQEEQDNSQEDTLNTIQDTSEQQKEHNDDNGEQPLITKHLTIAQQTVLAGTEKFSTPHIMTELEIIRKEIDSAISNAVQNRHFIAAQLTNDSAKTKELLKLTSSKRINEERKWNKVIERVGNQKAEEMKGYIKKIDEETQVWWKERQQKLNQAESLMVIVDKEQSASCRIEMVAQRPELSREIVLVEAAKLLSFITVKRPQNNANFNQWLEEQYCKLTSKLTATQANSVMREIYDKLLNK